MDIQERYLRLLKRIESLERERDQWKRSYENARALLERREEELDICKKQREDFRNRLSKALGYAHEISRLMD